MLKCPLYIDRKKVLFNFCFWENGLCITVNVRFDLEVSWSKDWFYLADLTL